MMRSKDSATEAMTKLSKSTEELEKQTVDAVTGLREKSNDLNEMRQLHGVLINEEQKRAENALLKTSEEDLLALQASLGASKAVQSKAKIGLDQVSGQFQRDLEKLTRKGTQRVDALQQEVSAVAHQYLPFCLFRRSLGILEFQSNSNSFGILPFPAFPCIVLAAAGRG